MNVTSSTGDRTPMRLAAIWFAVAVTAVGAVAVAPIAASALMIAAFGLPHVLYEMRYVDQRFGARSSREALAVFGALIAVIAAARVASGAHWLSGTWFMPFELGLGAALALAAAWFMRTNRLLGAVAAGAFALGAAFRPIETFLVWAWLHNLTPMGFVAEITEGEERRRWLIALSVPFFVVPGLVATGVFHDAAASLLAGDALLTASAFGAGDKPLLAFLPPGSTDLHLFSAAVVAQAMHYVAVIVVLPWLLQVKQGVGTQAPLVPWPSPRLFAVAVAAAAAIGFAFYAVSYSDARAVYGVAAAIHAWIELPVLLLALGGGFTLVRR
jgi:hypothetical protein